MKTDFYTKSILTVIAISLVILVLQNANIISKVNANPPTTTIPISTISLPEQHGVIDVNIKTINGKTPRMEKWVGSEYVFPVYNIR